MIGLDAPAIELILGGYLPPGFDGTGGTPKLAAAWAALPAMYRALDDGTLYALVAAMVEPVGVLELLADAIGPVDPDEGGPPVGTRPGGMSLLTDPEATPWTGWLAQAVGVDLAAAGLVDDGGPDVRAAIATPVNGWRAGSLGALEAAGRRTLTGKRTIRIRPLMDPDPFVLTVSTAAGETPDVDKLLDAITRVLPAGYKLTHDNNVGDWAGVEAPGSWGALHGVAPTWADVEQLYA